ncbi:MAG: CDP-glycerol glycerophosphotransferase family protein [Chlamydiota bacterium]
MSRTERVLGKRCLAVLMGFNHHILDHIAPLAALLDIPLLITEEDNYALAQEFYPMVNTLYQERSEASLERLANEYDALFRCTFNSAFLARYFGELCKKPVQLIYCPHGNSDKGHIDHSLLGQLKTQDGVLLYGQHMIDRFQKQNHWDSLPPHAITGNYRLELYLENRTFYNNLAEEKIFSHLPKKRYTLLYAPTWNDYEHLSSFFERVEELVTHLPEDIALLIKTHPLLEETAPAAFFAALPAELPDRVKMMDDFSPIYPLLDQVDGCILDFSSIGYDALFFEKPLFFFDPIPNAKGAAIRQLHQAGVVLEGKGKELYASIIPHLENWRGQKKQQELYQYAFGPRRNKNALQKSVAAMLSAKR